MQYNLTQEHIDKGTCKDIHYCAIALCLSEALGQMVSVTNKVAEYQDKTTDTTMCAYLDEKVQQFIYDFDHKYMPSPFTFEADFIPGTEFHNKYQGVF